MKAKGIVHLAVIITLGVALGISLQFVQASWNDAPSIPPQNNTSEPINVGSVDQVKSGKITASDLCTTGGKCLSAAGATAAASVESMLPDGATANAICSYVVSYNIPSFPTGTGYTQDSFCGQTKYSGGKFYTRVFYSTNYCASATRSSGAAVNNGLPIDSGWVLGDTASVRASNPWWPDLYKATATRTIFGVAVNGQDAIGGGSNVGYYNYGCSGSTSF